MRTPATQLMILSYPEWEAIETIYSMMLRRAALPHLRWQYSCKQQLGIDQPSYQAQVAALADRYPINAAVNAHRNDCIDRGIDPAKSSIFLAYTADELSGYLLAFSSERRSYSEWATDDWPERRAIVRRLRSAKRQLRSSQLVQLWCRIRRRPAPQPRFAH